MRYTLSILETHYDALLKIIFSEPGVEGAAYLLCGRSVTPSETRLLVHSVLPVDATDYHVREPLRLSIDSRSYARTAKVAATEGLSVVFVHSHPGGIERFSPQDDREEPQLMRFFSSRLAAGPHGSLVCSAPHQQQGRVWVAGRWVSLEAIRILGARIRIFSPSVFGDERRVMFDRQVRAFGPELQRMLAALHVGVVGAGGIGSAVSEQLVRLGVGMLSVFDGDVLDHEGTNLTRVYGSRRKDLGRNKATRLVEHLQAIGLGARIHAIPHYINTKEVAQRMRDCDIVFGCTDRQLPRAHLVQLSLRYLIPVFDLGVQLRSSDGVIQGIFGRVTTLLASEACLFCRGRITSTVIALESKSAEEQAALVAEGYAPELETNAPAVIMFTSATASHAITQLIHRLTGYLGDRASSESLLFFHDGRVRWNRPAPNDCLCADESLWGIGDTRDFLGVSWAR